MEVSINSDALRAAILDPAVAALYDIGETETPRIQEEISVPVGRDQFGNVIERSLPGEPPRMEEGLLHDNIVFSVDSTEDGVVLNIVSSRPPSDKSSSRAAPQELEGVLNRPYMAPALERIESYALEMFADNYARGSATGIGALDE